MIMDQLEYEEVIEWYNSDKVNFDSWELDRVRDCYNEMVQLENPTDGEKAIIQWIENVLSL